MTPQDLLEQFRRDMSDEDAPYLWSDPEILLYLIYAQDAMCKAMGGIADVSVALADIGSPQTRLQDLDATALDPWAPVSPYILRIRSGRMMTDGRDILLGQESDMTQVIVRDYGWQQGLAFNDADTGPVTHGLLGIRENYVRWVRVPDTTDTCRLHFFRLPYPRLTGWNTATDGAIEVPEDQHLFLVDGMRARAYLKQDAETYDKGQGERFAAAFSASCDRARRELERRRYRPRVVHYGGP